jgi:hypothetical protein
VGYTQYHSLQSLHKRREQEEDGWMTMMIMSCLGNVSGVKDCGFTMVASVCA